VQGAWFYNDGEWVSQRKERSLIRTSRLEGGSKGQAIWAIRYEHPSVSKYEPRSQADKFRIWRTDIAVNCDGGKNVGFSLQTSHYLLGSYFGPEPPEPEPNSPKIVKNIIESELLRTFSGSEPLLATPNTVAPNDAALLWQRILDSDRQCPLIYVSRDFQTGESVVNASKLAWGLAGLATIYVAESPWVDKTTESVLPENYRCWNGRIRVYLPGVTPGNPDEYKRHRYFTTEQLRSLGDTEFQRFLTRSFARRLPKTIDDLRQVKQQAHLEALKSRVGATDSLEEMVSILTELNSDLELKNGEQEKQLRGAQDRIEFLELSQQDNEMKLASAEYQAKNAREQSTNEAKAAQQLQQELSAFRSLARLPESIKECGDFFVKAFPGKLVFSQRGFTSLQRAQYSDVAGFWEAMWALASVLHKLLFESGGKVGDIEKKFKELTGIDMSMTEGSLTKADKRLMKKREDSYEGEQIDITPHIKLRAGNEHFRIYFGVLRSKKLLVVGECTNHLETAGSRRRGQ
jgi:hypothetical protein